MSLPNAGNTCYLNAATQLLADAGIVDVNDKNAVKTTDPTKHQAALDYLQVLRQLREVRRDETGVGNAGQTVHIDAVPKNGGTAVMRQFVDMCDRTLNAPDAPTEVFAQLHDLFNIKQTATVQFTNCRCVECKGPAKPAEVSGGTVYTIVNTYRYKTDDGKPYRDIVVPGQPVPQGLIETPSLDLEEILFHTTTCAKKPSDDHLTVTGLVNDPGHPAWIIQVERIENNEADRVLLRFPLRLHGAFDEWQQEGFTDMYLRGAILALPNHYTYLVRHDDGVWWVNDDSVSNLVSPLCAANEEVLSYTFGRQVKTLLYEYRKTDFPPYPLALKHVSSDDRQMFDIITAEGAERRATDREARRQMYADNQSGWSWFV